MTNPATTVPIKMSTPQCTERAIKPTINSQATITTNATLKTGVIGSAEPSRSASVSTGPNCPQAPALISSR